MGFVRVFWFIPVVIRGKLKIFNVGHTGFVGFAVLKFIFKTKISGGPPRFLGFVRGSSVNSGVPSGKNLFLKQNFSQGAPGVYGICSGLLVHSGGPKG